MLLPGNAGVVRTRTRKITNITSLGTFDLLAAALVYALNWKAKRRSVHHRTETERQAKHQKMRLV